MLVIIPFTSFAALVSCASIFAAPGLPHDATAQIQVDRRVR
ncbi:putative signal peptide protein [Puccinia sorghi]|uniref:Putative signal peptide protein n=1 Tax=Puccinia sorghi TaxID=27349 RepID=A0A0L6V3Y3_9BASI|nr:putative signal peptide protein [Puccinia sorghi]